MKAQAKKWVIASLAVGLIGSGLLMTQPVKSEAGWWCFVTPRNVDVCGLEDDGGGTGGVGGGGGNGYDIQP